MTIGDAVRKMSNRQLAEWIAGDHFGLVNALSGQVYPESMKEFVREKLAEIMLEYFNSQAGVDIKIGGSNAKNAD